jgi:hypothetical protein
MKFKCSINVPAPEEATADLDPTADAGLRLAHERVTKERGELTRAEGRLRDAGARADELARDVPAGRATVADLDNALRAKQTAALVMPGHQARVADAEAAESAAQKQARDRVIAEANRRGAELQAAADELAPVLTALIEAEAALDTVVLKLGGPGVKAVTWPACANDEGRSIAAFQLAQAKR